MKYILKAAAGIDSPSEEELEGWDEETYRRYEAGEFTAQEDAEVLTQVHEMVSLDWWVEAVTDETPKEDE